MSSHSSPAAFRLPDTLACWPWPHRLNEHYVEVKRASSRWLESFRAFSPKAQKAFNKCDFSKSFRLVYTSYGLLTILYAFVDLLASLAYPLANEGAHS